MAIKDYKYVEIDGLKPHPRNPRTHSKNQIQQIARSIEEFGFVNPILIDKQKNIIAGHGRVLAAKQLGITQVPYNEIPPDLTSAQLKAYVIADNKLAENAGWDREMLSLELLEIQSLDLEFDLSFTGLELAEIDLLLSPDLNETEEEPPAQIVAPNEVVTQLGDIYQLGCHRILCGDFTNKKAWKILMSRERAHMVFADPPYNVPMKGHASGLGKFQHDEFVNAHGEMSEEEFIEFLKTLFFFLTFFSRKGSIHFICMDWRHQYEILVAARKHYTELKNLCVWNKTNGGMGSLYRSKHELIFVFKHGSTLHVNNVELGTHGRYRTNVWDYAGSNAFHEDRDQELAFHPTCKPIAMIADAMLDCSHRNHLIVDPCVGSGSTVLAGERTQRRIFAMELDPKFVDTTIIRWQEVTGKDAIHVASGKTFNQMKHKCSHEGVAHG